MVEMHVIHFYQFSVNASFCVRRLKVIQFQAICHFQVSPLQPLLGYKSILPSVSHSSRHVFICVLVTICLTQVGTDVAVLSAVERRLDVDDAVVGAVKDGGGVLAQQHREETCTGTTNTHPRSTNQSSSSAHCADLEVRICVVPGTSLTVVRRRRLRRQTWTRKMGKRASVTKHVSATQRSFSFLCVILSPLRLQTYPRLFSHLSSFQ